ncbi:hypothetical protein STEG23_003021 [Scotinomys teguina]
MSLLAGVVTCFIDLSHYDGSPFVEDESFLICISGSFIKNQPCWVKQTEISGGNLCGLSQLLLCPRFPRYYAPECFKFNIFFDQSIYFFCHVFNAGDSFSILCILLDFFKKVIHFSFKDTYHRQDS